ncbi:MAG TPA: HD domain-containing phosphohydrolase [Gemmatimonadaceae bacterium]|nr:HD domain-containing phosphohydrolase [Gemmatimonadaceae bacterium]
MSGQSAAAVPVPPHVARLFTDAEDSESRGQWRVAREQYEHALRELSDTHSSAITRTVRRIARCFVEEGDLDSALDALELARSSAVAYDDTAAIAHAMNLEGIIAQQRGDLATAEQHYRVARTLAWRANEALLVAMLDQNLGTVANIRGNLVEAKLRYEGSLAAYRVLSLRHAQGPLHNNLGMLHTDLRQWPEAETHFREALRNASECGDLAGRLRAHANQAEMYLHRRRFRKAKRLCRRVLALSLAPDACRGSWLAEAYKHLGVAHRETASPRQAEYYLGRALEMSEERQDALLTAEILRELAILQRQLDRPAETLSALTRAHALFRQLSANPDLRNVDRQLRALETEFLDIVQRWGESIETADSYTQGHCQRVADVATLLAMDCGVEPAILLWFRMGALLHDVGKLAVPLEILNKRGALSPDELQVMREHPVVGEDLVTHINFPWDLRPMIRHHHERFDGTGYPDRLHGEEIPDTARILCVADVYDALTSTRSYRDAYAPDVAIAIMTAESGQTFDPRVLRIFVEHTLPRLRRRTWRASQPLRAFAESREAALLTA